MSNYFRAWRLILYILLISTISAAAAPQLEVGLGFNGQFVPGSLIPLQIRVLGVEASFSGSLLITERIGSPWSGEALTQVEFPLTRVEEYTGEYLVPIYGFTHPLQILLRDEAGETLTQEELDLRSCRRDEAFPLAVGAFPSSLDSKAVPIDPDELPCLWPAYESVSSLWLGRILTGISRDRWEAIGQWILAGGVLILFTGSDFYLLDTPILQDLLPLRDPYLEMGANGLQYLRGEERSGTHTVLARGGIPLLVGRDYGAGKVLLVTTSAFDVAEVDFAAIRELVPVADLVSFAGPLTDLLEQVL